MSNAALSLYVEFINDRHEISYPGRERYICVIVYRRPEMTTHIVVAFKL